jgi:(4S)-4-hydroxy-5-phosphonooxypentane-2,3-dione isomerase
MYGGLVRFVVRPEMRVEFLEFLRWDAKDTEPGTLRFDVWETELEPGVVYVYEAYKDAAAFDNHQKHEPFKKFDGILRDMIEKWVRPRQGDHVPDLGRGRHTDGKGDDRRLPRPAHSTITLHSLICRA